MSTERSKVSEGQKPCVGGGPHHVKIATPAGSSSIGICENDGCDFTKVYANFRTEEEWSRRRNDAKRNRLGKFIRQFTIDDQISPSLKDRWLR